MFGGALLVAIREGVEISIIIGIILSYLKRLGRSEGIRAVWLGVVLAVLTATLFGVVLYRLTGSGAEWAYQTYLEATVMFLAVVILSYMTFWMKRNSVQLGKNLRQQIDVAVNGSGLRALVILAFISVIREGIETVMFLLGLAYQQRGSWPAIGAGAVFGFAIAAIIGYGIYRGTTKVNLRLFFQVMGTLLIVVAAGLLSSAIGSLIEANVLRPFGYLYNLQGALSDSSIVGGVLHALIGYTSRPAMVQVVAWIAYIMVAMFLYNRSGSNAQKNSVL